MASEIRRSFVFVLVAIVGLVPFASDMYLSSLPAISREFSAPTWVTQLTLTGYLLLLGVGQLVAGPITDAIGRRKPLIVGMAVMVVGSLAAALAPSMTVLVIARILQGIGGAIAVVVANSSVRDRTSGDAATRLYAFLLTATALAPVIAPAAGGLVGAAAGWRMVFWILALLGALVLLAILVFLPESLPHHQRSPLALMSALRGYWSLFSSRGFVIPLVAVAAMFMLLFAYIGGAAYVYQGRFGIDQSVFGLIFGATGLSLLVGSVLANRLAGLGGPRLGIIGVTVSALGTVVAVASTLGSGWLWGVVIGMALGLLGLGMCEPAFMGLCMSSVDEGAGQAAALLGAGQYIFGAVATIFAGSIAVGSAFSWTLLMLAFAVVALALAVIIARGHPVAKAAQ